MARKTYKHAEAVNFLRSFQDHVKDLIVLSKRAETEATKDNFELYHKFRAKVSECETFSIMVEQRLRNLEQGPDVKLNTNFDKLYAAMLAAQVKASIRFFFVLSMSTAMPMGAREMFMEELKRLHTCHAKLSDERYIEKIDAEQRQNVEIAAEIIEEIIERAPNMFSFSVD
jgi:hypothetical protein